MEQTWDQLRASIGMTDSLYGRFVGDGPAEMANAFLNRMRCGGSMGYPESFADYTNRTGRGNAARGWWGRPRLPQRCMWPIGPCAPGCTAKHVDGDALDGAQVAA